MLITKMNSIIIVLFSVMLISSASLTNYENDQSYISSPDIKQEQGRSDKCKDKKLDRAQIEQHKQKKLAYIAQYFGIEVEGKSIAELREAIEQAKKEQPEKWALLKQEMQEKKLKLLEQKSQKSVK